MIDIQLLRMMRVRSDFNRVVGSVNPDALDDKTRVLIEAIGRYYKKFPTHKQIDFPTFVPYFFNNVQNKLNAEDKQVFTNIIRNMGKSYPDEQTRAAIMENIHELNLAYKIQHQLERYNNGEDIDFTSEISGHLDAYKMAIGVSTMPEVGENIDDLLDNLDNDIGIHWRLGPLNKAMRPLRGGDFGIIAARPDQGKTSFFSSELTFMAPQLPAGRPILWLNNEGPGFSIRPRLMQAALNCTVDDLFKFKSAGTLYERYFEAVGGEGRIRIMDIHGYNNGQVETLIDQTEPGIIVYDMIDNVRGFGDAARTDLQLEKMYQWAREKAVKYDAIGLAASQISAEGENCMFPPQSALKDSKTGKQGACEFICMIGSMENDSQYASTRWVSLPKNKLRKPKSGGALQEQVKFDRDRARFNAIEDVG